MVFFYQYIALEKKKDAKNRQFGAFIDLLPTNYSEFPFFFSNNELKLLEGCQIKEDIEYLKTGIHLAYREICKIIPA